MSYDRELLSVPGTGFYEGLPDMEMVLDKERRKAWQPDTEIALGRLELEAFLVLKRNEAKRLKNGHIDQIRDYYLPFI